MPLLAIDVDRARAETPGAERACHLNNAGAALMPAPVVDALQDHVRLEAEIGGYEAAEEAADALEHAYDALARLVHCARDEIAIVDSATSGWRMPFYSIPFAPGDRILTAVSEYGSNFIAFLQVARRTGAVIDVIPSDDDGAIDLDALAGAIDGRVKLIALTHAPTNGGLLQPAAEVGRIARAHGIPFILDACQSAGQVPLDVDALGCDILSATGRKFLRGPRAIGFVYVRRELCARLEPPLVDGHAATWTEPDAFRLRDDARRFEACERSCAGQIALGVAADYALGWGLDSIRARVDGLASLLRARLAERAGVTVHDQGRERTGIVTFSVAGHDPAAVRRTLAAAGVRVWSPAPHWWLLDRRVRDLPPLVRASVHYYNTEDEIARAVDALPR
jgi:selenocysteine lyase/cysteine desulfurase